MDYDAQRPSTRIQAEKTNRPSWSRENSKTLELNCTWRRATQATGRQRKDVEI